MDLANLGRWLLVVAALIAVAGLVLLAVGRGLTLGTSILISLVLTLLLNLFLRR